MELVYSMDVDEAIEYIRYLLARKTDELLFLRWAVNPYYQKMSFDEFKLELTPAPERSDAEIIEGAYEIIGMMGGGRDRNI